jgi:hypothetical protein
MLAAGSTLCVHYPLQARFPCQAFYPVVVKVLTAASSGLGLARHVLCYMPGKWCVCIGPIEDGSGAMLQP